MVNRILAGMYVYGGLDPRRAERVRELKQRSADETRTTFASIAEGVAEALPDQEPSTEGGDLELAR